MALSDRDKRTLKIGGIVAGVLLLGVLAMNVFAGGGEEEPPDDRPSRHDGVDPLAHADHRAARRPTATGVRRARSVLDPAGLRGHRHDDHEHDRDRDDTGRPRRRARAPATGTGTGTTSQPTQPGNGSSTTVGGRQVTLIDVFTSGGSGAAQVEIGGQVYNVTVGETFGPGDNYELRSTSGNCATFLYGDESFTLCVTPEK